MIDFDTLVARVQERDVRLTAEGQGLSFDAPPGALTDDLLAAMRHHKADLVAWLTGHGPGEHVVDWAPATPEQDRMSRRGRIIGNHVTSHLAQLVTIDGPLDVGAVNAAFTALVERHGILRTRFVRRGERLVQEVLAARPVTVPVQDLRAAPDPVTAARDWCWAQAHRPFDVGHLPLLRIHLLRVGDERTLLLLVFHHIIVDGWSLAVLYDELATYYTEARRGLCPSGTREPLPRQFTDYARWSRGQLDDAWLDTVVDYWRGQLAAAPPPLELPYDRPRPAQLSGHGRVHDYEVGAPIVRRLETMTRRRGATLFTALLGGFALLLCRLSGQDDVVLASSSANRTRAEHEPLIGLLARGLTLRVRVDRARTFGELVDQARDTTVAALHHQPVPIDTLLDLLTPGRDPNAPVFRAGLVLVNSPPIDLVLPDLTVHVEDMHLDAARADLTTILTPDARGALVGGCEYPTDLFDPATVAEWFTRYVDLLDQVSRDPDLPLDR